jgi:acyl-CoA thioesterase
MTRAAYFTRVAGGRFLASDLTSGAWAVAEQHISPMAGLVTSEIERAVGPDNKVLARLSLDILGVVAVGEFDVTVEVTRPGRTIALVEVRVTQLGRPVVIARAWRLASQDTAAVAGGPPTPIPGPDELPPWDMGSVWPGGYIGSLEVRRAPDAQAGRAVAWVHSRVDLIADEPVSDLARWMALIDTANGLSVRTSPDEWLFPNVDLTIHLHRPPRLDWVGFDTRVIFGATGLGLTSSVLHDLDGPVGQAEQILTVRRRT